MNIGASARHQCGQCEYLLQALGGQRFFCLKFHDDGEAPELKIIEQRDQLSTTLLPIACQQCPGWSGVDVKEREIEVELNNTMCEGELEAFYKLDNLQAEALRRLLYSVGIKIIFDVQGARIAGLSGSASKALRVLPR